MGESPCTKPEETKCTLQRKKSFSHDTSYFGLFSELSKVPFFFFFKLGRIGNRKVKYVYYLNLYLVMNYFIQFNSMDISLFSTDPAKRLSILGLPAYFFQLLLFLIPSVVILLLSSCFHY